MAKKRVTMEERASCKVKEVADYLATTSDSKVKQLSTLRKMARPAYRKGRGKAKGKGFERDVGKVIGEWWRGKPFRPTPMSGGWDKLTHDEECIAYGDLYIPKDCTFPWSIECKDQEGWELIDLLKPSRASVILNWWKQCTKDAYAVGKNPLLVFSRNNLGCMLVACLRSSLVSVKLSKVPRVLLSCESDEAEGGSVEVCIQSWDTFIQTSMFQPVRTLGV